MKLIGLTLAGACTAVGVQEVNRKMTGSFVDDFVATSARGELARAAIDGSKGFRPLAAMMLYMTGFGRDGKDPESKNNFERRVKQLENRYTNYGCYCWIDGVDAGVIGGGKVKDVSDHHCKELYRCYKCVTADYAKNYTDVTYTVDFTHNNGQRELDCSVNSKQDAENICECDKRFAANIAQTEGECQANPAGTDPMYGEFCQDEKFRTATGGGNFNPREQCDKNFHGHNKDKCCGIYPNRYPYDSNFSDCCRTSVADGNNVMEIFSVHPNDGRCEQEGGEVVVSVEGDPHSYVNANNPN